MILYSKCGLHDIELKPYIYRNEVNYNNILCFDIETTSGFIIDNEIKPFDYSKKKEFYDNIEKTALCYIWTLYIDGVTYYGRTLEEFKKCVDELHTIFDGKFTIWVHNLSWEFQFLLNIFDFDKIFARSPHKIIYADFSDCRFRCSYFLTRLSLETWGKELGIEKLVGALDYNVIRTPITPLSENQLNYAERDVVVMGAGIEKYLIKYKKMHSIPLTQTGEIRKVVKDAYKKNMQYHNLCAKLMPETAEEYARLVEVFSGGYTHANYTLSNIILKDVHSCDLTSSYPTVMCAYKFPMTRWWTTDNYKQYLYNDNYSMIMDITFVKLESVKFNNYLSSSKAYESKNVVKDNGRVSYAKEFSVCITNIDFEIIEKVYKWESMIVNKTYVARNGYLDKKLVEIILDKYGDKTTLKNVDGKEEIYLQSKQFINSIYGMMVTAIVQDNVIFSNDEWRTDPQTPEQITEELKKKKNKAWSLFNAYQWGVWVTAYARRALWYGVMWKDFDADIVYMDTDSIKYINNHDDFFEWYNNKIIDDLHIACDYHGIDYERIKPKDPKGIERPLGIFDKEPDYDEFITLGAKRYAYKIDGEIGITVAGANKKKGVSALKGDLKNFKDGLVFNYHQSGRSVATYLSDMPILKYPDGYISNYKYGINLMPTTYTLGLSGDYKFLLQTIEELKPNFRELNARELHALARGDYETEILLD